MNKKDILERVKDIAKGVMNLKLEDAEVVTPKEIQEAPVIDLTLAQETLDNGTVLEAESFEAGQPVFIVNEDERVPLPVGEYEKEGMVIVVTEEGMIGEIKEAMAEEPEAEVEAESEYVTITQFNEAIEEIKSMFSKQTSTLNFELDTAKTELDKVKATNVELQKEIDEIPDAKPIKNLPKETVKLNIETAKTSRGRIMQFVNNNKN